MRLKPITASLIIINVAIFLIETFTGLVSPDNFVMYTPLVLEGEVWRLFTSMFLHFGVLHLVMNMIALNSIGNFLERYMGSLRFSLVYIFGGLFGSLTVLGTDIITQNFPQSAGASGAIFALLGAVICIAIKDKNLDVTSTITTAACALLPGFIIPNVSISAHLGGLIGGFLTVITIQKR